jgi:hypothetical protein
MRKPEKRQPQRHTDFLAERYSCGGGQVDGASSLVYLIHRPSFENFLACMTVIYLAACIKEDCGLRGRPSMISRETYLQYSVANTAGCMKAAVATATVHLMQKMQKARIQSRIFSGPVASGNEGIGGTREE